MDFKKYIMAEVGIILNDNKMNRVLKNWNLFRIIRLLLGIIITIYSLFSQEYVFLILGGLFSFQAIMNVSCCGAGGCYTDNKHKKNIYGDQIKEYKPD